MNLRGTDRSTAQDRLLPRRTVFSRGKVKIYDFLLKNSLIIDSLETRVDRSSRVFQKYEQQGLSQKYLRTQNETSSSQKIDTHRHNNLVFDNIREHMGLMKKCISELSSLHYASDK